MALSNLTNGGEGTLAAGISSVATTATCTTGHGARLPASGSVLLGIWNRTDYPVLADAIRAGHGEYVLATRSSEALTLTRAQEGTTAVNLNVVGKTYAFRAVLSAGMLAQVATKDGAEVLTNKTVRQTGAPAYIPVALGAGTVIDTAAALNVKEISTDVTLSYSATPSVTGSEFKLSIANTHATLARVVTLPSSPQAFNISRHELVTSFSIPPTGQAELVFRWDGAKFVITGINDSQFLSGRPVIQSATLMGSLRRATITQTAHGFTQGMAVRFNGTSWVGAIATGTITAALPVGVVESVPTLNTFNIVPHGPIDLSALSLTAGIKYLSATSAGVLSADKPSEADDRFVVSVLRVVSASEVYVEISDPLTLAKVPLTAIAGIKTDSTNADPSNNEVLTAKAYADNLAAILEGLTMGFSRVTALPEGTILLRAPGAGAGAAMAAALGAGFTVSVVEGVLTISVTGGGGTSAPVAVTGSTIDWTAGTVRTDTLTADKTYSLANVAAGVRVTLFLSATGGDWTPDFGPSSDWGDTTAPLIEDGKSALISLQSFGTGVTAVTLRNGFEFDIVPPSYVSTTVPSDGNTFRDLYSEELSPTIVTTTGRTMSMNGQTITGVTPVIDGDEVVWTASPRILAGNVNKTANAYTAPTLAGVKDLAGNFAASFSGRQADITNASTYSPYIIEVRANLGVSPDGTAPAFASEPVVGSSPTQWRNVTAIPGFSVIVYNGTLRFDLGAVYNKIGLFWLGLPKDTNNAGFQLQNAAFAVQAAIEWRWDRINVSHGTASSGTGTGTNNQIVTSLSSHWVDYEAESPEGSGANGKLYMARAKDSTTFTRPGNLNGAIATGTGDGVRYVVFPTPAVGDYYLTNLLVSTDFINVPT